MSEHLLNAQNASTRGRNLSLGGDYKGAFAAYLEAAEEMLLLSCETAPGQKHSEVQSAVKELILKAQQAKDAMTKMQSVPAGDSSGNISSFSQIPKPVTNSNAIKRDIEQYQHSANTGNATSAIEDRNKFVPTKITNVHFSDIAGLENVKRIIQLKVIQPILHPELYARFEKSTNGGILLYGPPGTGKTMIARAIACETDLSFFSVKCSSIVGTRFGDGERNLNALFDAARASGRAMIFFDEFESLACKRGGNSTVMNRIVPELLSQMDGFQKAEGQLIVLASTNRPWDLDSAVLRPPRMSERIYVGLPDFPARRYIIEHALDGLPCSEPVDYDQLAKRTEGFNCSDITELTEKIKEQAIERGLSEGRYDTAITMDDIEFAFSVSHSSVQKSDLEQFSRWEESQR